jgi:hypothetical protein
MSSPYLECESPFKEAIGSAIGGFELILKFLGS